MCDGNESPSSLLWLIDGTDETDCEDFWCLSSPSTRCNGYWDCIDGRDELNCSLNVLPTDAKSMKLLHTLNGCDTMEHFCLHVSNRSRDLSRSCIPASYAGDGYVDCWGATDERHNICQYGKTTTTMSPRNVYRCFGEDKICVRVREICDGRQDCPMGDDEKLCDWRPTNIIDDNFLCGNGTRFHRFRVQCNSKLDCPSGEDEWFCDLEISAPRLIDFVDMNIPFYPPSLQNNTTRSVHQIQARTLATSSTKSSWYCNRGISIADSELRRCLCPGSYSGERCEYQRERISVILQIISPPSLQRDIAIKFVLYLIDVTSLSILVEEEILHLPYIHSSYKHLVTLSSVRANNSFVRIDAYEVSTQQVIAYRTSWKFDLPFPFLPVRRLATRLDLTDDGGFVYRSRLTCHACLYGQCLFYRNSDDVFCHCYNGWTGPSCNESFLCAPVAMSLNSRRCLCPMNRHGIRCFVPNRAVCQCQNGATCIPLNARTEQSACLCSDNYFGQYCERQHASLTIETFGEHQPQILPIVLFQFVDLTFFTITDFQNTFLLEHVSIHRPLVIYHVNYEELPYMVLSKVFYSSSIDDYRYYIVLYMNHYVLTNGIRPKHVQTQLEASQQCLHVRQMEVFKTPINILAYPYIKRIKFYLRGCSDNKTRCFHDEIYLCLCPIKNDQAANCIIYDHTREVCQKSSYCLNEGLCIENRRNGMVQFACLCPSCHYYGALCQFSLGQHGLSLDALVGIEMRTGKTLSEQSILIKLCTTILISMITFGFIGNILCIITFAREKSREAGCGYYLFVVSVCNQLALIMLGLRFVYLLVTQMVVWNNRVRSLILCQCLEYGLTILPNLSNWLSACVSVERTFTVARGALFNQQTSIRIAKRLCIVLLIVLAGMTVHESINRQLIEDPRLGRYTWCVAKFNSAPWRILGSTLSFVHLLGPFLINFLSTGILIVIITRQKLTVQKDKNRQSFSTALRKQAAYYKHLIISPTVLLILALPRLIISLGSLCIDTSWRNYVFIAGYFISFIPFMTTLFIFVIPAPVYRDELKVCLSRIRRLFTTNRCSH